MRFKHVRFYSLKIDEVFYYGKLRRWNYSKSGFFSAHSVLASKLVFVMPWTKVRSTRPFGKQNRLDLIVDDPRPSVPVTPGGDRTPETIGGKELTPSA